MKKLHYEGTGVQVAEPHKDAPKTKEPYLPTKELVTAVNLAIFLRRPLLLEGEAGCGKSRLAYAVAYELGLPLYTWSIKSVSKATEGLYTYDAMRRLHDIQTEKFADKSIARDPYDAKTYRRFGALGKAFEHRNTPAIILIDEIDKADLDFPNDLLTVLDDPWSFEIPETGEKISADTDNKPIVIITSNKEKGNLPAPFLRRCIYHFVKFPEDIKRLKKIVNAHIGSADEGLVDEAVNRFIDLRQKGELFKKPGTSEFLDWLKALHYFDSKPFDFKANAHIGFPYPELLFKLRVDWQRYQPH